MKDLQKLRNAFHVQKHDAGRRNIVFALTFAEWLSIWTNSGHLDQRGNKRGNYVMARFEDRGAYTVGNVKIIPAEENAQENGTRLGKLGKTPFFKRSVQRAGTKASLGKILRGEDCYQAQLTKAQVRQIRKLLKSCVLGEQLRIAERYGVSKFTISQIKHNRIYKD